jgi:hypothetical protein
MATTIVVNHQPGLAKDSKISDISRLRRSLPSEFDASPTELLEKGRELIVRGNINAAKFTLARAAELGRADAALALGEIMTRCRHVSLPTSGWGSPLRNDLLTFQTPAVGTQKQETWVHQKPHGDLTRCLPPSLTPRMAR